MYYYYTPEILLITVKDFIFLDIFWTLFLFSLFYVVLDSFYSIKEQRFKHKIYYVSLVLMSCFIVFQANTLYQNTYKKTFNRYYIFYLPILKEFVYQKNFGNHSFEYGIKDKKIFDRVQYEAYLPFVYWRNLDIQNKLPLHVDAKVYDKNSIKYSRLSLSYEPSYLNLKEVELYPLINPNSKKGVIQFPEHMIQFNPLHVKVYNYDKGLNLGLSNKINILFKKNNVVMPIRHIWGKTSNMKPYDLGYFLLDSKDRLFNLKRKDNIVSLEELSYPKSAKLEYIKISENRQKQIIGYAIDKNSNFYLIDWNLNFKQVNLLGFDYRSMKLQFISNVLYSLIRYDDGKKLQSCSFF